MICDNVSKTIFFLNHDNWTAFTSYRPQEGKSALLLQSNSLDFTEVFPETAITWVLQKEGRNLKFTLLKNPPTSKAGSYVIIRMDYLKNQGAYKILCYSTGDILQQKTLIQQIVKNRLKSCSSHIDYSNLKMQSSCYTGGNRFQNNLAKLKLYQYNNWGDDYHSGFQASQLPAAALKHLKVLSWTTPPSRSHPRVGNSPFRVAALGLLQLCKLETHSFPSPAFHGF